MKCPGSVQEEEDETLVVSVTDPATEGAVDKEGNDGKAGVKVEATLTF